MVAWVYDALLPYVGLYVVEGIGAAVRGPVDLYLGLLADARLGAPTMPAALRSRGEHESAHRRDPAHRPASRRRPAATALVAAIDTDTAERVPPRGRALGAAVRRRRGEAPGRQGLADLAQLLAVPGREIAALDLAGGPRPAETLGPVLDAAARDAYRRRLQELEEEHRRGGSHG